MSNLIIADNMVVGYTYEGTADCPLELDGMRFTLVSVEPYVDMAEPDIELIDATVNVGAETWFNVFFSGADLVRPLD